MSETILLTNSLTNGITSDTFSIPKELIIFNNALTTLTICACSLS